MIEVTGRRGRKRKEQVDVLKKKPRILQIEGGSTRWHSLENWLCENLWSSIKTDLLTYLLTPWCRVLLGLQLVKKFHVFHGTRRFITALTSVRQLSLSWASPIQSIYPHHTSWRSILILSTHLRLGLPSSILPSGFPGKTLYTPILITHTRHMPSPLVRQTME